MERVDANVSLRGHMTLSVYDEYPGMPVAQSEAHNILCNIGLNSMLNALVWASVNDQVANMGTIISYSDMTPLYGAVGTGGVTTIASGSNGLTLPQGTIAVASVTGFPNAGTLTIVDSLTDTVTYTGTQTTPTPAFTGCTGGTGVLTTGNSVTYVPAATDTSLCIETARNFVASTGTTVAFSTFNPSFSWLFILPSLGASQTITEAGVFVNATEDVADGSPLLDHAMLSPAISQSSSQLVTLLVTITAGN